jgi:hypothetical protein
VKQIAKRKLAVRRRHGSANAGHSEKSSQNHLNQNRAFAHKNNSLRDLFDHLNLKKTQRRLTGGKKKRFCGTQLNSTAAAQAQPSGQRAQLNV